MNLKTNTNEAFGELFNKYRLKAGLDTYSKFGHALAEEGYVYEDSIFSKWKKGERVPRDRNILIAIIKVFLKRNSITSADEIETLFRLLDLRDLSEEEKNTLDNLYDSKPDYTKYAHLVEPNALFQEIYVNADTTRFVHLESLPPGAIREYWKFQSRCAVADYYSQLSDGNLTPNEVFNSHGSYEYSDNVNTETLIAITVDPITRKEFLTGTLRLTYVSSSKINCLEISELFNVSSWSHMLVDDDSINIGELSRFVIPSWAISSCVFLSENLCRSLMEVASNRNVKTLYCIISAHVADILEPAKIFVEQVPATPKYLDLNAKEIYPIAYKDAQNYPTFWKTSRPMLSVFTNYYNKS